VASALHERKSGSTPTGADKERRNLVLLLMDLESLDKQETRQSASRERETKRGWRARCRAPKKNKKSVLSSLALKRGKEKKKTAAYSHHSFCPSLGGREKNRAQALLGSFTSLCKYPIDGKKKKRERESGKALYSALSILIL